MNPQRRHSERSETYLRIPLADLTDYLRAHNLRIVAGDPDLHGHPWRPPLTLPPASTPSTKEQDHV